MNEQMACHSKMFDDVEKLRKFEYLQIGGRGKKVTVDFGRQNSLPLC